LIHSLIEVSAENYYSCELTAKIPIRVQIMTINGIVGLGILEGREEDLKKYISGLKKSNNIKEVLVTYKSEKEYWTRTVHDLPHPSIHDTILESGSMSLLPIIIEKGVQTHQILSPTPDAFDTVLKKLKQRFEVVKLKSVYSTPFLRDKLLTQKQFDAFKLAFDEGYYEIPRNKTIEDMAKNLGIKRVAMQERLRRAEKRIFNFFMDFNI
jgi:predicted DNA binding protein